MSGTHIKNNETPFVSPQILDGRVLRDRGVTSLKEAVSMSDKRPTLAIIQVGSLPESSAYIEQKRKFAEKIGAGFVHRQLPDDISEESLIRAVEEINDDSRIHGVIVQLPIPQRLNKQKVIDTIASRKDVDGLTSANKKLFEAGGAGAVVPATARGVLSLLRGYGIEVSGKRATVIGRSALVGAPIATLLAREGAIVTVCHKETKDIPEKSRQADILIVAIGQPRYINREYVSAGEIVVDVGINSVTGKKLDEEIPKRELVGDVDFEDVKNIVGAISPVPGGVGPMTVLSLFENLFDVAGIVI